MNKLGTIEIEDILKASRHGEWLANKDIEIKKKIHKSKKTYSRKQKHK